MARTLPTLGLVSAFFSSHAAWANPDDVRHADEVSMYASLELRGLSQAPSGLAPPPSSERIAENHLVEAPPRPIPRPRRWGVFGAGIALFGVAYAADAGLTYGLNHASPGTSLIPLAGPLLQIGQKYSVVNTPVSTGDAAIDAATQSAASSANQAAKAIVTVGLVLDFAVQLAGLAMMIAGPASHVGPSHAQSSKLAFAPTGLRMSF